MTGSQWCVTSAEAKAGAGGTRFLLVFGRPLHEPVAWYGPIVMNQKDEIATALRELRTGQFIKEKRPLVEG